MSTMNAAPEVRDFLATVRTQLADLDPDEQREILDGLEADLADLVAERGGDALGDPVAYARELRAAAGLDPEMRPSRLRSSVAERTHGLLDGAHARWDTLVAAAPGDGAGFLEALRPAWWVLRAWIAVQVAALAFGDWGLELVPGGNPAGAAAVLVAVALSVQLGRGRLWPAVGWRRVATLRLLLLGLNCFAVAMVPVVQNGLGHGSNWLWDDGYQTGYDDASFPGDDGSAGLVMRGEPVRNIYPYDAQGQLLTGVQLVDSSGRPLTVTNDPYDEGTGWGDLALVPWLNGKTEQFNVFPLAEQRLDSSTLEPVGVPALQPPPFASLPPVSLEGVTPSQMVPPER